MSCRPRLGSVVEAQRQLTERTLCRRTSTDISTRTKRLYLATFETFEEVCAPLEPEQGPKYHALLKCHASVVCPAWVLEMSQPRALSKSGVNP